MQGRQEEREYWQNVELRGRRNMGYLLAQAVCTTAGMVAFVPGTVLPAYLKTLTDSKFLIALPSALDAFSWSFPALFYLYFFQFYRQRKGLTLGLGAFVRGSFLILAVSALVASRWGAAAGLAVFFAAQAVLTVTGGGSLLAWQDYLGRTIPPLRRGTFFGVREALNGLVGFAASLALAVYLAGGGDTPGDYIVPFFIGIALYSASLFLLSRVDEPQWTPARRPERSLRTFYRKALSILIDDPNFRAFVYVRCLLAGATIFNLALFSAWAIDEFDIAPALVAGAFTASAVVGRLLLSPIAGRLADRVGFRLPLLAGVTSMLAVLIIGLLLPLMRPVALGAFLLIYFMAGAAQGIIWVATFNLQLEFGGVEDRPRNIAVSSTISAPIGLIAGGSSGLLVDWFGYQPVIAAGLAVVVAAWLTVAFAFKDPRFRTGLPLA